MRWNVHSEKVIYDSPWVSLRRADVELPDRSRVDHHLVRVPAPAAGTVVADPGRGILMMWRHRFITDTWGWEIPAGRIEQGEDIAAGAAREVLEETGWQPGPLEKLASYHPSNGLSDQTFHLFLARSARRLGEPTDWFEAERVEWLSLEEVRGHLQDGLVGDGLSFSALCWCLAFGKLT